MGPASSRLVQVADTGEDVLQAVAVGGGVVDVVGGHDAQPQVPRQRHQRGVHPPLAVDAVPLQLDITAIGSEPVPEAAPGGEGCLAVAGAGGAGQGAGAVAAAEADEPRRVLFQERPGDGALVLGAGQPGGGQEAAQVGPAGGVLDEEREAAAVVHA